MSHRSCTHCLRPLPGKRAELKGLALRLDEYQSDLIENPAGDETTDMLLAELLRQASATLRGVCSRCSISTVAEPTIHLRSVP